MDAFWKFARQMLRQRRTVIWACIFAVINAGGLGVGLLSMMPMLKLILETGSTLPELANQSPLAIPQWLVAWLPADRFQGVALLVGFLALLTVVGGFANFMHQYLAQTLATKTIARIRQDTFRHVIHMPLMRVVARGPSEFVARIVRDAAELQRGFIALLSKSVTQILKGIAAFIVALVIHWQLTLAAIIVAPILAVILRKLGKRIRRGTRGSLQAQEGLLRVATESLRGLRAVKANTGERQALGWFHRINKDVVRQELRVRTALAMTGPIAESLAVFVIGGLALLAAKEIIAGTLPFTQFMMVLGALAIAGASFRPLAGLVNEIQASAAPAARLAEILDEPRESQRSARLPSLAPHAKTIVFEGVSHTYAGADQPALREINLTIKHGERVAIVGPNGSGKTTLVSLLPRLIDPKAGRVLIDDVDINSVNVPSLRRQIGVVTQETVLFRGTIAENIAFGAGSVTREQLVEAARRAHAEEFISAMPGGYDADVAEQGASLSGGQRQRLAIARAILRNPTILILDEATSQIDAESEAHINAAVREFCAGRTAIHIAHRLSTVLNADRIVVMEDGAIAAQGTHDELLAACELYRRLTETQLIAAD